MEGDDELKGEGNSYDYGARMYDPRVGRWFAPDPVRAAYMTPYVYVSNDPIRFKDPTGAWETDAHYWTVLLVALMLDIPNAYDIAYWDEYPDTKIHGNVATERYTWAIPFVQQNTHSLTGGDGPSATRSAMRAVIDERNSKEMGRLLHLLGDTFAHRKLGGNGELYGNKGFTLDHAISDGNSPDMIGNRPELYLEYVKTLAATLAVKYNKTEGGGMKNFDISVFEKMAKYAANSDGNPISLIGIINYEVSKASGGSEFVVHKVQSLLPTSEAYQESLSNTKSYLDKQGVDTQMYDYKIITRGQKSN